jgi:L-lactate dehydrogenase complex protein LldG
VLFKTLRSTIGFLVVNSLQIKKKIPNIVKINRVVIVLLANQSSSCPRSKIYCKEPKLLALLTALNITPFDSLADCDASITSCKNLVARTGTIVLSSEQEMGRTSSVYAPIHICIAFTNQIVFDLQDVFNSIKSNQASQLPSLITFASGPSRTADIEKTLVTGVHGPKEVYCFLVEE